jgi:hypothetical protein
MPIEHLLIPKVKKKLIVNIFFSLKKDFLYIKSLVRGNQQLFTSRSANSMSSLLFMGESTQFTLSLFLKNVN